MSDLRTVIIAADSATIDGGLGKVAVTSALALRARGLDVVYFCPLKDADTRLQAAGVTVNLLGETYPADDPNRLRGMRRGIWNSRAASALREICADHDPATTILHCHGFSKGLSPAVGPILANGPIPSVYTMHEFFLACPNGGFFDFQKAEICTRKPLGVSCLTTHCDSRAAVHKVWRVARQVALHGPGRLPQGLKHVITISNTQERAMAAYLRGAKTHRVTNPVDFTDTPRVPAEKNDFFIFVGRLASDKGAVAFAQAAKQAGVQAVFVGDGPEKSRVQAILPEATFTGWVAPDVVSDWMARARALVFPSLWYECQPLVPMEALRRGVPVITGRWNAAHEVVTDGQNGIIIDDIAGLADALSTMTPALAGQMSHAAYAGRDAIGSTPAAHAQALCDVYATVRADAGFIAS